MAPVIFRSPPKADERATATISAAIPPAWMASMPGVIWRSRLALVSYRPQSLVMRWNHGPAPSHAS
jgi:hypothetical protein